MCFVDQPFEKPDANRPVLYMLSGQLDFTSAISEFKKHEANTPSHMFKKAFRPDRVRSIQLLTGKEENHNNMTFVLQFEDSVCTASLNDHKKWSIQKEDQQM